MSCRDAPPPRFQTRAVYEKSLRMADNPNHCDPLSRMSRPEILESSPVPLLQVVAPLARFFVDERAPEVGEPRLLRRYLVLTNDMAGGHHRPFPATTTFVSVLSAAPLLVPLELVCMSIRRGGAGGAPSEGTTGQN